MQYNACTFRGQVLVLSTWSSGTGSDHLVITHANDEETESDLGRIPQLCIRRCKAQKLSCRAKRPRTQVNFLSAPWNIALLGCRWDCHSVCKSCMYLSVVWTSWGSPLAWSPWGSPGPALYWWRNQGLSLFPFCWGILNRKDHLTEDPYWVLILESKRQIQNQNASGNIFVAISSDTTTCLLHEIAYQHSGEPCGNTGNGTILVLGYSIRQCLQGGLILSSSFLR